MFTFPLRHDDGQLGTLDLYRDTPGTLDDHAMVAAQSLADVTTAYVINARARDELVDACARAQAQSLRDALTSLPNRVLLFEVLSHAVVRCRRSEKQIGVLFADLDDFKAVNDLYGHHIGDLLLVAIAERLTNAIRPGDTLGRLSGDEFVIICEDLNDSSEVDSIARRINAGMAIPFVVAGNQIAMTASLGVAISGQDGHTPVEILHHADTAMYQAKRYGGARHETLHLKRRPWGRGYSPLEERIAERG